MSLEHYLSNPKNPTLCDLFKAGAKDTWARIYFSRKTPRLKIHETSISQNLVYEMNLIKSRFPALDFELFESTDEKANGDDLVLSVVHDDGNVHTYAIQSKIIYHKRSKGIADLRDGHYKQLKHWVGKGKTRKKQVDLLLDYARTNGYTPLYLLYNYVGRKFDPHIDSSLYGCSIISAQYLKDKYTTSDGNLGDKVKFSDLHIEKAIPWHELICTFPKLSKNDIKKKLLLKDDEDTPKQLSTKQLPSFENWEKVNTILPTIFPEDQNDVVHEREEIYITRYELIDIENSDLNLQNKDDEDEILRVFNPKFQIVVGAKFDS